MRKLSLLVIFLIVPMFASAASLTISNPVKLAGPSLAEASIVSFSGSALSAELSSVSNLQAFGVQFDLTITSSSPVTLSFDANVNNNLPWSVSLLSEDGTTSFGSALSNGFTGIVFNSGQLEAFTTYKLLVQGDQAFLFGTNRSLSIALDNIVVSEVPLPAAVWLFGSALIGGLAIRRKRLKKLTSQAA